MPPVEKLAPRRHSGSLALALLLALVGGYFAARVANGFVLHPHDNAAELGAASAPLELETLYHLDVSSLYVPETAAHLADDRSGWLSTWTPRQGLGRPLFQFGACPTFIGTHVVARLTSDPYLYLTWSIALAVIGTALFTFLFARAIGIGPAGSFVAGLGLSLGPLYPSWGMIPMIQWGYCWTFAALLAVERWVVGRSPWSLVGLCFACHAILLTGFLQHVNGLACIAAGWAVIRIASAPNAGCRARLFGGVLAAVAVALASVAPVYLDLYHEWARSTRADEPQSFRPSLYSGKIWPELLCVLERGALGAVGLSFGMVHFGLACAGALRRGSVRGTYWFVAAAIPILANDLEVVNRAFASIGFRMSDWPPVFAAHAPGAILAGAGVDALLGAEQRRARWALVGVVLLAAVLHGADRAAGAEWAKLSVVAASISAAIALALAWRPDRANWIAPAAAIWIALISARTVPVWTPRSQVMTESPLTAALEERSADGSRSVWVGDLGIGRAVLPPNMAMTTGLRSLTSYDHLTSRAFHRAIEPYRDPRSRKPYRRWFEALGGVSALDDDFRAFFGVRTLLSFEPLEHPRVTPLGRYGLVHLSALEDAGPLHALVPSRLIGPESEGGVTIAADDLLDSALPVERPGPALADALDLRFAPLEEDAVLFLSQEYHRDWHARTRDAELETVIVNGLLQGVRVPAGASEVTLRFEPRAPWILLSQIGFAVLAALRLVGIARRRARVA